MGILEFNEDGVSGSKGFVAERFLVGESGGDMDEDAGDWVEDGGDDAGKEKWDLVGELVGELDSLVGP